MSHTKQTTIEMYSHLYGKEVMMDDRFETKVIWSEELAIKNNGKWIPKEVTMSNKNHFIASDIIDGDWLSPIPKEREWQIEKLVEIFGHYPTASPRWQYMNGLIHIALEHLNKIKEDDDE